MQLDWVSGFTVDRGCVELEVVLTPVLRCFDGGRDDGLCSAAVRMHIPPIRRAAPLSAAQRCAIGNLLYDDRKCSQVALLDRGEMRDPRPTTYEWRLVDLQDHNSGVVTFGSLAPESPLSTLITERAQCPPHTAFFLIHEANATIAIPTSEVLMASYVPTAKLFSDFIAGACRATDFMNDPIGFDGFAFAGQPRKLYPFRALRNVKRGFLELEQLLPRACAYWRRHGTMPIIIRPPFIGRVAIGGYAITRRTGAHEYVVFVEGIRYMTAYEFLSRERDRPLLQSVRFAPVLFEDSVRLDELGASATHSMGRQAHKMDVRSLRTGLHHIIAGNYWTTAWKYWQKLLYPNLPLSLPSEYTATAEPYTPELGRLLMGYLGL